MTTSAEYLEILRQYQSELDDYKKACSKYWDFQRHLPLTLSTEQEREMGYQLIMYKKACKKFHERRTELKKRMTSAGYGGYSLGQKNVTEAIKDQNFRNQLLTDPELIRQQVIVLRTNHWAEEDILYRFNLTKEQLDSLMDENNTAIAKAESLDSQKDQNNAEVFRNMYRAKYGKDPE